MGSTTSLATGSSMSLSTTYAITALTEIPDTCGLVWLRGALTSISSASQVTWYLAADSDGDIPLTDELLVDIVSGATTAGKGGVASSLDIDWAPPSGATTATVYLAAKVDAGTATMAPSLVISQDL